LTGDALFKLSDQLAHPDMLSLSGNQRASRSETLLFLAELRLAQLALLQGRQQEAQVAFHKLCNAPLPLQHGDELAPAAMAAATLGTAQAALGVGGATQALEGAEEAQGFSMGVKRDMAAMAVKAEALTALGRYREALEINNEIVAEDTGDKGPTQLQVAAENNRALLMVAMGRHDDAVEAFEKLATKAQDCSAMVVYNWCEVDWRRGAHTEASRRWLTWRGVDLDAPDAASHSARRLQSARSVLGRNHGRLDSHVAGSLSEVQAALMDVKTCCHWREQQAV